MLNIIYGTENSNRKSYVDELILKQLNSALPTYILVPEQFSLSAEKDIIQRHGIMAQTKVKVITFSRLCNLVFSRLGPLRLKYIDGAGKQILAARTIRALKGKIGPLSRSLLRRGFSSDIASLVSEFKRYGVSPYALSSVSNEVSDDELSAKLKDISLIYDTFDTFLNESTADAEDNLALICPKIKDCDFLRGKLFIRHFRSFTPTEHKVIGELMGLLDIYVDICCDDIFNPVDIFSSSAETTRTLISTAENSGILCEKPIHISDRSDFDELDHLSRNYFATRPKAYNGIPEKLFIYETTNIYRETEMVADLILRLCRTEGRRFSDFLILARNTDSYNRIAPAVFASRGIDIFLDKRRSLLSNPLATLITTSLDILANGFSYERVMSIARTGLTGADDDAIDRFENYLLAVNPTHAMWGSNNWTYCPEDYDLEDIVSTRDKTLRFYNALSSSLSGVCSANNFCSSLLKALEECSMHDYISTLCEGFASNDLLYIAEEYRMVWNGILAVISQIASLMDTEAISRRDFYDLFRNACSGISIGLTPQTQGSVVLSSIDKFRGGAPIVIVLGMNDGVFPKPHTTEGIISDLERDALYKLGIQLAPGADFKQREELTLIYSVLTAAKDKLYLFSPLLNTAGTPLSPSPVIKNIKRKIFPSIESYNPDLNNDILHDSEGLEAAFEILCTYLSERGGNIENLSKNIKQLYEYFANNDLYLGKLNYIMHKMQNPKTEKLSRDAVVQIYGDPINLSASKLEKYNSCAYAYFLSYGLLASEREKSGIEPRSTGSVQHAALYRYFSELKESGFDFTDVTKDDCYKKLYLYIKEEVIKDSELLYESSSYYKYVVTKMQGIAARTAWEVVKFYRSSRFRPFGFEIKIGTDGMFPSIEVKDNNTTIAKIRGFIDKADIAEVNGKSYILVTDYKSSSKDLSERLADAGINLQPLLYSDIIARRMQANPAAMLYMQMTDPIVDASKLRGKLSYQAIEKAASSGVSFKGWISDNPDVLNMYSSGGENGESYTLTKVEESELKNRIERANEKIHNSAMGIYNGNISAKPYCDKSYNACEYCIFSTACIFNK